MMLVVFACVLSLFVSDLHSLNRDYAFEEYKPEPVFVVQNPDEWVSDETFSSSSEPVQLFSAKNRCADHAFQKRYGKEYIPNHGISRDLLRLIPKAADKCTFIHCQNHPIYFGYLDPSCGRYRFYLLQHLEYSSRYVECNCYWPECSEAAAEISDVAYMLFNNLVTKTALNSLLDDKNEQRLFQKCDNANLNHHGMTVGFIAQHFQFSHYYHTCRDVEEYTRMKYGFKDCMKIKSVLNNILDTLYPKFLSLYRTCLTRHHNSEIEREVKFMKLLVRDAEGLDLSISAPYFEEKLESKDKKKKIHKGKQKKHRKKQKEDSSLSQVMLIRTAKNDFRSGVIQSDFSYEKGSVCTDFLLYEDAIAALDTAIQLDPLNENACIERARAYFETGDMALALKEYKALQNAQLTPRTYEDFLLSLDKSIAFPKGLLAGTIEGAKVSAKEFVPSVMSSCKGIGHGLWSFVCSPDEVSRELLCAAYELGSYLNTLDAKECLELVVPEVRELGLNWHALDDYERGNRIGYIIGKYGVDVFVPGIVTMKGVRLVQNLKKANIMMTLEMCAASNTKQAVIIEESIKHAAKRNQLVSVVKSGKIIPRNSNVQFHVMQPKHAWDKLIALGASQEEDFRTVIAMLEKSGIMNDACRVNMVARGKQFFQIEHEMVIEGYKVRAVFIKDSLSGEMLLNDAWVVTR